MPTVDLPGPWRAFLRALDEAAIEAVDLYCLGGFTILAQYGLPHVTGDLDVLAVVGARASMERLLSAAGRGSSLHQQLGIFLDIVTVATCPYEYEDRLIRLLSDEGFVHLRLFALDPYDVALTKLPRNLPRDREDVLYLADVVPFDLDLLQRRYQDELRPYLGRPEREDLTLQLWIDAIVEQRTRSSST